MSSPHPIAHRATQITRQHARIINGYVKSTGQQRPSGVKPAAAYRQRVSRRQSSIPFNASEIWHAPLVDKPAGSRCGVACRVKIQPAGSGYMHPVTAAEVRERIALLPEEFREVIEVVQFSRMTRKRLTFPCYGMQWGFSVYLYPIEESLVETYSRPPRPDQRIEAAMYGAEWREADDGHWNLHWTAESIRDFYLNNVLIHEIGHLNDSRNTSYRDRERFANWFAIEYGFRASRGRHRDVAKSR